MRDLLLKHLLRLLPGRTDDPLQTLQALWPALVGTHLALRSRPDAMADDTLIVACATPALAQEVRFIARNVLATLADLNQHIDVPRLHRIHTRAGDLSSFPPTPARRRLSTPSTLPLSPRLQQSLDAVEDEDLRTQLERITRLREANNNTDDPSG